MSQTVIAVSNQKGGVGKTTSSINIAAFMAKAGKKVLLVDLDPQGNATSGLGLDKTTDDLTMYDVLVQEDVTLDKVIKESNIPNLFVAPADAKLAAAEVELVSKLERESILKRALSVAAYDYVLIDCPPSLGLLTINALTAANYVLVPVQAEYYALEGLSQLLAVVQRVRQGLNTKLELLGVVLTMFDNRTSLSEQVQAELNKHFGDKLLKTVVPRNIRLAEAPSHGKPISEHDKWSKGGRAYKQLAKEVMQRAN